MNLTGLARTLPLLLAAIALAPAIGVAQQDAFDDAMAVTAIEIPVRVLRGGEPVRGLTRDDFQVSDRGEPQEIVAFQVVDLGEAAGTPPSHASPGFAEPGFPNRHFLLFFDLVYARPGYLMQGVDGARKMVEEQLHPTDRVAVGYYSATRGAQLVTGFSADRERVAVALHLVEAMIDRDPKALRLHSERLADLRRGDAADPTSDDRLGLLIRELGPEAALSLVSAPDSDPFAAYGRAAVDDGTADVDGLFLPQPEVAAPVVDPVYGQVIRTEPEQIGQSLAVGPALSAIRSFTLEMRDFATWLRSVPGQKQLVYFSEGFASSYLWSHTVTRYVEGMLEAFRRGGWTIHAIDVEGVPQAGAAAFDAQTLFFLANETGGDLMENFNRTSEATGKLMDRTSVVYLLTIQPQGLVADGSFHRLDVEVADIGWRARVVHRAGYYAPKPAAARTQVERRMDSVALLLGKEQLAEISTDLLAIRLPPSGDETDVPVVVEVGGDELTRLAAGRDLQLEIQAYAIDASGGVQDLLLQQIQVDRRRLERQLAAGGLRFFGSLRLPPGSYRLRYLVAERRGGQVALGTVPFEVPRRGEGPVASPPLFVQGAEGWLEVGQAVASTQGGGTQPEPAIHASGPFARAGRRFVPTLDPVVGAGDELPFLLLVDDGAGDALLEARVVDADGDSVGADVAFVERRVDRELGRFELAGVLRAGGLGGGRYHLEVTVKDAASGRSSTGAATFSVR